MESVSHGRTAVLAIAVVATAIVGSVALPGAWSLLTGPDGTVAVVSLEGGITSQSAAALNDDLRRVSHNESIDAVVLRVDSPGGAVGPSESLYLAVRETASEKPVVATVTGTAASGGYMAVIGADRVYATPSSMLGSVGVYGSVPTVQPSNVENLVTSAPTKGTAGRPEDVRRSVERIKRTFVGLVMEERGANLTIDRGTVARAKVYTGKRGVALGFADAVGGRSDAIEAAAHRAGLDDYRVVTVASHEGGSPALASASGIDTTRYYALHGLPDRSAATIGDGSSARAAGDRALDARNRSPEVTRDD